MLTADAGPLGAAPVPPPPLVMPFGGPPFAAAAAAAALVVVDHPATEVRTRTPGDKRTFSCALRVYGAVARVQVALLFSPDRAHAHYTPAPERLLGGVLACAPNSEGVCNFTQLWLWEPSAKHDEREFCLRFVALTAAGEECASVTSNSFYAFSHARVLKRRRDVVLRALNKTSGCSVNGGDRLFVVGRGFIDSPTLSVIIQTPGGETRANQLEFWSECVLFFTLPPLPLQQQLDRQPDGGAPVPASLFVSNDGRSLSNGLDFSYSEVGPADEAAQGIPFHMMRARY